MTLHTKRLLPMTKILLQSSLVLTLLLPHPCLAQRGAHPLQEVENFLETFSQQAGPLAPMFGKLTPEQAQRLERVQISAQEETRFGKQVLGAYLEQLSEAKVATTRAGRDVAYLAQLCEVLRPQMVHSARYRRLDIRIIESEATDAYSIPGGHLLLARGLLDSCGSEASLLGTLAHELSHLDRGHQLLQLKQAKLSRQPLNFNDSILWISLVARPFRPEQESEADRDATQWMMAAGYEPAELARLLNHWQQQQARVMPWMQFLPTMIKSHPNADLRAAEVLRTAQQLRQKFPQATYVGAENLKQRIPKSVREFR